MEDTKLLEIKNLSVEYHTDDADIYAINNINLSMNKGETLGLVGETGAGKTTVAKSILGILPQPVSRIVSGEIWYEGEDLLKLKEKDMQKIRGNDIAMIFQDPMTSLNPIETVGFQIYEAIKIHNQDLKKEEAIERAKQMLEMVGIPGERYYDYPHEFSGGMKQRVVIAMALACNPKLLLADEPTTALDVTIQAQVLDMMQKLRDELKTSVLLITHDFGVVAGFCDVVAVTYAGEIIERGPVDRIFNNPQHPYTIGLFNSLPHLDSTEPRLKPIKGLMPDPSIKFPGCRFSERCPYADERCAAEKPAVTEIEPEHLVKCFRAETEGSV
ncbi:MAG: ABC transporter ATP-binding protein [Lachnospiraceae bacterium]|nr:ABC transporter ATP-binding protein [Lachnospiraceae bacterium]